MRAWPFLLFQKPMPAVWPGRTGPAAADLQGRSGEDGLIDAVDHLERRAAQDGVAVGESHRAGGRATAGAKAATVAVKVTLWPQVGEAAEELSPTAVSTGEIVTSVEAVPALPARSVAVTCTVYGPDAKAWLTATPAPLPGHAGSPAETG